MSDILCVTNRKLCGEDFLTRLERVAAAGPRAVLLREKDLSPADYAALARSVLALCRAHRVPCILHSHPEVALAMEAEALHLPLPLLRDLPEAERRRFPRLGASCHSPEEAREAESLGCTYLFAGHIFDTDCKRGLPGRGLDFLARVCRETTLPVYAIGGVAPENIAAVRRAGAAGACLMSSLMTCPDPAALLAEMEATHGH